MPKKLKPNSIVQTSKQKQLKKNSVKKNPLIGTLDGREEHGYLVMRRIMNLILMGYDDAYIVDKMVDEYGTSQIQMRRYVKAATCALDDKNREWEKTIVKKNFLRLDAVIDECYQKAKYKELLQAIDLQNKLAGAYTEKIRFETPIFEIKINNQENNELPQEAEVIEEEENADK